MSDDERIARRRKIQKDLFADKMREREFIRQHRREKQQVGDNKISLSGEQDDEKTDEQKRIREFSKIILKLVKKAHDREMRWRRHISEKRRRQIERERQLHTWMRNEAARRKKRSPRKKSK